VISIDGSGGEGGGQVLRTSIALSAVTRKPVTVFNIRAKRSNPGLRPQHLNAIQALAKLCGAELKGSSVDLNLDIGTAGSITLVLQALMIPALYAPGRVRVQITGGTDVGWSPSIDYLRFITLPVLRGFGYKAEIRLVQRGYYPVGCGEVVMDFFPSELKPLDLLERGGIISAGGISHAHFGLAKSDVAARQAKSALKGLSHLPIDVEIKEEYVKALSYGSGITLWAETRNSWLGADSLGERGKSSEAVGGEAARNLIKEIDSKASLDKYMADQIIPYIALAGGFARVSEITKHTKTNVDIVNKFGFKVRIEGNTIKADKFNLSGF
jgi:RNA 3'-terminal phosphate cyclase (GTP)